MYQMIKNRIEDNEVGGVVIEYGIVVAVIALGLIAVGAALVGAVDGWFDKMATKINSLPGSPAAT
ncbi:MAG: Flp family type IVb pilin [Nitriliruptorales bacterium]|nr:Flp family type IVb pilin [Nitriliruptorales bacterium]